MTAPTRAIQQATGPTNTVSVNDIEAGKEKLDQWIRKMTGGAIGWSAVNTAGSVIPGVGTVFAAVDAIGDLLTLIDGNHDDFLTWVSFGINVVGLVSFPGVGPARLTIRTTLSAVRREGIARISDALLSALEKNLNDKTRGTLESFAQAIESRLNELLTKIAAEISKACAAFANMLRGVASDQGQKALAKNKASLLLLRARCGDSCELPDRRQTTFSGYLPTVAQSCHFGRADWSKCFSKDTRHGGLWESRQHWLPCTVTSYRA